MLHKSLGFELSCLKLYALRRVHLVAAWEVLFKRVVTSFQKQHIPVDDVPSVLRCVLPTELFSLHLLDSSPRDFDYVSID